MDNRETLDSYFKFLRLVIKYLLFASLDFLFWMIVHTKWRKDCNT